MKSSRIYIVLLLCFCLWSCSMTVWNRADKVYVGMDSKEFYRMAGPPDVRQVRETIEGYEECLLYKYQTDLVYLRSYLGVKIFNDKVVAVYRE